MNTMSDTQKAKLGAKYIDGSTVITETDNGTKYKVNDVTETSLVICKCNKVKGEEPFEMPFTELTDKFDKNEINISGYEHTEPDSVLLHQVVRDIMAGKALAKKDNHIAELEEEVVEHKEGGHVLSIKLNKQGVVKEIKNRYGKILSEITTQDGKEYIRDSSKKIYKWKNGEHHLHKSDLALLTMKRGGKLQNQYAGHTAQEVWDNLMEGPHRLHLLSDHKGKSPFLESLSGQPGELGKLSSMKYSELPEQVQEVIYEHVSRGQYKKGAKVTVIAQADLDESAKKLVERYLGSSQTMLVEKLLTEGILKYQDIQNSEIYPEWYGEFKGQKLSFPGGSYQEREDFSSKFDDLIEEYPDSEEEINTLKEEFESATEESRQQEVFEWIPVQDDWFKEQLVAKGVPVLESEEYNTTWWGRTTFGQMWMADSVIQNIAKEMLSSRKTGGYAGYREGAEVRYNGYKNYPTHNIKLWIDNDESSQSHWNERAEEIWKEAKKDKILSKRDNAIYTLQEELKTHFNDENPLEGQPSTYSDILQHRLDSVEWREVAIALLSEKMKWNGGEMKAGGKPEENVTKTEIKGNSEDGYHFNVYYGGRETAGFISKNYPTEKKAEHKLNVFLETGKFEMKTGGPTNGETSWKQKIQLAFPDMPEAHFDRHESDLYVKHTPELEKWLKENYPHYGNITKFKAETEPFGTWFEIPFVTGKWEIKKASGGKMKQGGKAEDEREFRYINLKPTKEGIELSLTPEGKELATEMKSEGKADVFILPDLFDDVQGNSEYRFHNDLGEAGFGLTSAPGITDGYYPSEDVSGEWEATDKSAKLYYFDKYQIYDMVEEMLDEGKVILIEAKAAGGKMKIGGKADITPNYYRFRQHSPKGVTECAVPSWGNKVAESVKKGAKVTTCKKDGKWFLQSIMIPKNGVKTSEAKKYANEIKDKFTRKKKALGGQAETCTCEEIHSLVDGFKIMRDNATSDEEKQKYEQLISDLS